ncbi:hypothetical protein [Helicobacter canis]|uniref:hypothetical protein n=1 Tax=Helicobacter canis TaxID=29419 RepID=UPI000E0EC9D2|nr:hypothetical protein [Helicobacter canis]
MHALAKPHFYHPNPTASNFALKSSQSHNSSSTILESFAGLLTFLAFPKADSSSTILQSHIAPQIQLEYKKLAQLLESSFSPQTDSPFLSSRALRHADPLLSSRDFRKEVVAIHNKKVDSSNAFFTSAECMDCRAIATALARNDKKNAAILNEQPKDSRFCDEKPLLCKPRKEIRLAVYRHSAAQQSKVYRAKPNPPAKFN